VSGVVVAAGGIALAWVLLHPRIALVSGHDTLATVEVGGAGGTVTHVAVSVHGQGVRSTLVGDRINTTSTIAAGTPVTVRATLHEPGWISWITGSTAIATERIVAPSAHLVSQTVDVVPGHRVHATFNVPVRVVTVTVNGRTHVDHLPAPVRTVALTGPLVAQSAGQLDVAAVPDPWESPPAVASLTYFAPKRGTPMVDIPEVAGTAALQVNQPLQLRFSEPVARLFGGRSPTLTPTVQGIPAPKGTWSTPSANELVFTPSSPAFWPNETLNLQLPTAVAVVHGTGTTTDPGTSITLTSAPGSILRLQQLLATLGYLPLSWTPSPGASNPTTLAGQAALVGDPQPGTFAWRWTMPQALTSQWVAGADTAMTTGAVMSFEDVSNLDYDANATTTPMTNPLLWPTLIQAVLAHQTDPRPYVWVEVSESLPENLWLWSNGSVVISSAANTGIPQQPTQTGTFPVYLRYQQNYMSGTNPNGSPYHDLVHWISYFNGSDAVHGFPRASYGFQQSLGCVELPVGGGDSVSHQVWGYDHIGTLVTVLPPGAPTGA